MRRTLAVVAIVALGLTASPAAATATPVRSWQSYVLGPHADQVTAKRAEARGAVTNAGSLVRPHGKPMTLTTTAGQTPASVILDFGRDIAGTPYLDIAKVSGTATLNLVTGEAREFLRRPAATTLAAPATAGARQVTVASATGLEVGNTITLGGLTRTIVGFDATTRIVDLDRALDADVPRGHRGHQLTRRSRLRRVPRPGRRRWTRQPAGHRARPGGGRFPRRVPVHPAHPHHPGGPSNCPGSGSTSRPTGPPPGTTAAGSCPATIN